MDGAPEKHEIVHAIVKLSQFLHLVGRRQKRFDLLRQGKKFADAALSQLFRNLLLDLAEVQREQEQTRHLRGERLGGGDADLRTSVGINETVRLPRNRRAFDIRDGDGARSLLPGFALRCGGVGGFSRLRNKDTEFAPPDDRVAVFELAGVVHIDGHAGQFLHHELPRHSRMTAGARSHDVNPSHRAQFLVRDVDLVQVDSSLGERDARRNGSPQGVGLLEDFSNQMMWEFARFSHCSP